jgi:peptide/nickel transport system permease protein
MLRFLVAQLAKALFAVLVVSIVAFLLLRSSGNPVDAFLPIDASEQQRAEVSKQLGLDQPLPVQYGVFLLDAVHGNFGRSIKYGTPALDLLLERLPATLLLTVTGLGLASALGIPLGVMTALKRGTWLDAPVAGAALVAQVIPSFWLGLMLILLFAVQLHWLPTSGLSGPSNVVLPAITLAAGFTAQILLLVRSGMLEVLGTDYTRTARAKGLGPPAVVVRHALRNSLIPVVTLVGLTFGQLLSGVVVLETVFSWPGVGQLAVLSIYSRDFPVVQTSVVILSMAIVVVTAVVDLSYGLIDPRARAAR